LLACLGMQVVGTCSSTASVKQNGACHGSGNERDRAYPALL
jgi:hypothetical protein